MTDLRPAAGTARSAETRTFVAVLIAVTLVFAACLWPFVGAILWAVIAAIMFSHLNDWMLRRMPGKPSRAAGLTLLVIAAAVLLPAAILASMLIDQASGLFYRFQSGQIDLAGLFGEARAAMPQWMLGLLDRWGIADFGSLSAKVSAGFSAQFRNLAGQALNIGQGAASFLLSLAVMLYLTFFLLRDGRRLARRIGEVIPLAAEERAVLATRFVTVVRATVKGGVVVGLVQGALGGAIMAVLGVPNALLWAVVMAFSSLLPAVGTGLVWVPAALYLLATGHVWQGIVMALCGLLVIGSVDNVLRPILIGRETKIPDALVLVTTLGGLATFGFNGLLIGPVAAALFLTIWTRYSVERQRHTALASGTNGAAGED